MIVTEAQVIAAMRHWEVKHIEASGPLDGITLPKPCAPCAKLVELLGAMWFAKEDPADLPVNCEVASLIAQSAV